MADFRDVVSVLPCGPTNKGKKNLCGCEEKANRPWEIKESFVASWLSSYVEPVTLKKRPRLQIDWRQEKGALFSLIYFFGSFFVYYVPHNYVIPQTPSAFYPHRLCKG